MDSIQIRRVVCTSCNYKYISIHLKGKARCAICGRKVKKVK